jgi:hypothetical protein
MAQINVQIKTSADGKSVVLETSSPNEQPTSLTFPTDGIGALVVGLLGAAIVGAQKTGSPAPQFAQAGSQPRLTYAQANGVALCDTDKPNVIGLVFAFGSTQLGIGLPREALQGFGSALLATTADSSRPQ